MRRHSSSLRTLLLAVSGLVALLALPGFASGPPAVVFLTPCPGGCTYTPGLDDPATNKSSLLSSTRNLSQYSGNQQSFEEIVSCLRGILAPFAAEVVTVEPASGDYLELAVAGLPTEAGYPSGVGSVAPFDCTRKTDSVAFVFANLFGSTRTICELAAAEVGHLSGLDNELQCTDVMSYLSGCGDKAFTDVTAPCGEFSQRACQCGGSNQNSYRKLLGALGGATLFGDDFETNDLSRWSPP